MDFREALADYSAMTAEELRLKLRALFDERRVNPVDVSRKIGRGPGYLSDFLRGKKDSLGAAETAQMELSFGLPPGSLHLNASVRPVLFPTFKEPDLSEGHYRAPPEFLGDRDLPVFAAVEGGIGEMVVSTDPIEIVPRPWYLKNVKDGYAVLVVGESMEPRYRPGNIAIVNPKAALVRGEDCIVTTAREGGDFKAMLKTYAGASEEAWRLKQFNPAREFTAKKKEWPFCVRVVGRYDGG